MEKGIGAVEDEKKMLFKVYNESLGSKKQLAEERKNILAEWKQRHGAKAKEKIQVKNDIREEYENELKDLEGKLHGLSRKDRIEQGKWKELELKVKYKLEEQEKEKAMNDDLKYLLTEKKDIENEFKGKRQSIGKEITGKDILQKQKELNDRIREHENGIRELNKGIKSKEKALKMYESGIEILEEEKINAENALLENKKKLGGFNYVASLFKFSKTKRSVKRQVEVEEKRVGKKTEAVEGEIKEQEGEEKEADTELKKSLEELGKISRKAEEQAKKPSIIDWLMGGKVKEVKEKSDLIQREKAQIEIKKKLDGKSRLFVKCHKLLLKAKGELQNNNVQKAKELYLKTRDLYIKLEYDEKKEIYDELTSLYNQLKK